MNTRIKKALGLLLGISLSVAASAQVKSAIVHETTTDLLNKTVGATITFDGGAGTGCNEYSLRFSLKINSDVTIPQKITVISGPVKNSAGSYVNCTGIGACPAAAPGTNDNNIVATLAKNDSLLTKMRVTGYNVQFPLPSDFRGGDTAEICVETVMAADTCRGCGIDGTDLMMLPSVDVQAGCPYLAVNMENDLVACRKRDSYAANWEAWIRDQRDCNTYRIVLMPDGRWWFAQNLNYWGDNTHDVEIQNSAGSISVGDVTSANDIFRTAWCPAATDVSNGPNTYSPCKAYGALYPWTTVMSLDGKAININEVQYAMNKGQHSERRGICPAGWVVPSRSDWGAMVNQVEYMCTTLCTNSGANNLDGDHKTSPCFHNYTIDTNVWAASRCAFKDLLGISVAPWRESLGTAPAYDNSANQFAPPGSEIASPSPRATSATDDRAIWSYFYPSTAPTDKWGFSALPAGLRSPGTSNRRFYDRGEFAGFWTSTQQSDDSQLTPDYATASKAYVVGFRFNYFMNPDFNAAIQNWAWDKRYGFSVRCVKE